MKNHRKWIALAGAVIALALFVESAPAQQLDSEDVRHTMHMVELRDGVKLATSVYLPLGEGPWPVILSRTPYRKDLRGGENASAAYTDHGYARVVQDVRGRFKSEGDYVPHEPEQEDGYDTVEWVAAQPWCTGKVGMTGISALGITANLAAAANPPHLVCAWVVVAPQSLFYEARFVGGVLKEADTVEWLRWQRVSEEDINIFKKRVVLDDRWRKTDFVFHRHKIDIPIYNVGGWYDLFVHGNVSNFQYLQDRGLEGARGRQRLQMGPFGHGLLRGDIEYIGEEGVVDRDKGDEIRWFDHWLKGESNGIMDEPPIRYFMMAAARKGDYSEKNEWRTAERWPPAGSTPTRFYLTEGGGLSRQPPGTSESASTYKFDPANPVDTFGGLNLMLPLGPMDQRKVGARSDYLKFETATLTEDVAIAGKIDLELWAATDGADTDFIAKLVDVYPDGYEALVLDTAIRTRYRHGRRAQDVKMMTPGVPELMNIDMWHSAITFEKGHKIALHLTSSNFPRYEVNPNTGHTPGEAKLEPRIATNTIYHNAQRPTSLILPVLE